MRWLKCFFQVNDDFQEPKELPFANFSSPKARGVLEVSLGHLKYGTYHRGKLQSFEEPAHLCSLARTSSSRETSDKLPVLNITSH